MGPCAEGGGIPSPHPTIIKLRAKSNDATSTDVLNQPRSLVSLHTPSIWVPVSLRLSFVAGGVDHTYTSNHESWY